MRECPALIKGEPNTSGSVCLATCMSGNAMGESCPIRRHRDSNCNLDPHTPTWFIEYWENVRESKKRARENRLG